MEKRVVGRIQRQKSPTNTRKRTGSRIPGLVKPEPRMNKREELNRSMPREKFESQGLLAKASEVNKSSAVSPMKSF